MDRAKSKKIRNIRVIITNLFMCLSVIVIVFVLMIIEGMINKKKDMYIVSGVFLFGSIAYGIMMMLLYVFSFGEIEGPMLAAYNRYMISYVLFGALVNSIVSNKFSNSCNLASMESPN